MNNIHDTAHEVFWSSLDESHKNQAVYLLHRFGGGDIDDSFLGFLGTYHLLSQLIPEDRVVYDVGCAYAFQAWFFRRHRGYVGISPGTVNQRFTTGNTRHVECNIEDFKGSIDPLHFAIHNYCPGGRKKVVELFTDLYTFYPKGVSLCLLQ